MKALNKLIASARFGTPDDGFELLETEKGTPNFFNEAGEKSQGPGTEEKKEEKVCGSVAGNEAALRHALRADINPDVIFRHFSLCGTVEALAVYMNGMSSASQISDFILRDGMRAKPPPENTGSIARYAIENVFCFGESKEEADLTKVKKAVIDGLCAVFIEGSPSAVIMDTRGYEHRAAEDAQSEKVVRGPQEGFVENIRSNITLLRRIIRTDDLVVEQRPSGGENGLNVAIVYREGVTNEALVNEVKQRIALLDTRTIINSGTLEQLTEKGSLAPFPRVLATERPDRTASLIMEGRVAVLLDGSPFANVMPTTLFTLMSTSEDSAMRRPQGSTIRIVRFIGAVISVILPAYFIALALHHQGLLSTEVLITVVSSRKMVFVPLGAEMIFLLIVFQLVREAGMRVPGNIGQAIGIIGGLILGQAAVSANLASSVLLIVVALTGLGNFCIPDYSTQLAAAFIRVSFVIAAWLAGLLGLFSAVLVMLSWMAMQKSYGVPFLAPFSPKANSKRPMILRGDVTMHKRGDDIMNAREDGK